MTRPHKTQNLMHGVPSLQMLLAGPAGWLADRYRRDSVLRVASLMGACAAAVLGWVLFTDAPVWMLYVAMGLIGAYRGFNNPAVEVIARRQCWVPSPLCCINLLRIQVHDRVVSLPPAVPVL